MRTTIFPDPNTADENGIVCIGGRLSAPLLVEAYSQGIFPWPDSDYPEMLWFSPDPRGVLPLADLHISASLKKWAKKSKFRVVLNQDFKKIVQACAAASRPDQTGTWITKDIMRAYSDLHDLGLAYSVAVYNEDNLVGGLYGVAIDRFVSAESMFFVESNSSKLALWSIASYLYQHKIEWMDIQMVTPISQSFGGVECPRDEFLVKSRRVLQKIEKAKWWSKASVIILDI